MRLGLPLSLLCLLLGACASSPDGRTLAELKSVEPDLKDITVQDSLDRAMDSYRRFLKESPGNVKTPEAMRRLADLEIEKRYGIIGGETDRRTDSELPAPESAAAPGEREAARVDSRAIADLSEAEKDFEARAAGLSAIPEIDRAALASPESGEAVNVDSPRQAIETYQRILTEYPNYERNDQVLYQMARAYDELGEPDEAMAVMERLIAEYSRSAYTDEVYFRRAEYFFVRRQYMDAEESYSAVVAIGDSSDFYELALYKLGWSLYKQELYEEALHQYMALLDYKVSIGYDFTGALALAREDAADAPAGPEALEPGTGETTAATESEEDERRVADTFRVISLAFSNLGGPEVVGGYFAANGNRPYEDRIYSNLGEFYFDKLRYNDAATVYRAFTELYPYHRVSPHFSMRVVEIYDEGGFGQLVVDAKREFATRYGLNSSYWQHYDVAEAQDVLGYLKTNLEDLAKYYHALYQTEGLEEEQPENYAQALRWYREYLVSFPEDQDSPAINYQLADLLLEHEDYEDAALEYERTAYAYPEHAQSAAAGYAAIFAHREHLKVVDERDAAPALLATVESSLKFANTFPDHEQAATVLGAAAEDLYDMQDFDRAIAAGSQLIDRYPGAESSLRRSAWSVIANASFDLALYAEAESAYSQVLGLTPADDEARQALYDNLAASIYKQGEAARELEDYRTAADHFLRISTAAPTSTIRPSAEYDAATALMKLEDWDAAAEVFRGFRTAHPDHELGPEVTKQLAFVYQQSGNLVQSAAEYERVADDAEDPELKSESLLLAGSLYEDAGKPDNAIAVYERYVEQYPHPIEVALEIRFKMAGMHDKAGARDLYIDQLEQIVAIDARAGGERTPRTRFLAGRSALVLAEPLYDEFTSLELTQPFEKSLAEKKRRMDKALAAFEALVDYEVADVTAAATFYMAETYSHFGAALLNSERPADLDASQLAEYNMAIEGEAFPFEERAIEVHEKNLELMTVGTFNPWIQRSLDELAVLMPGRYAKAEISSGFIGPVEVFAYRSPAADALALEPGAEDEDGADPDKSTAGAEDGEKTDETEDGAIDVSAAF